MLTVRWIYYAIFLLCFKFSPTVGQNAGCVDKDWCSISTFASFCTNPAYQVLMQENCPRICGLCGDPGADDERCTTNNGGCEQRCKIENDKVQCDCYAGYGLAENGRNCSDINECQQNRRICSNLQRPFCINRLGSYDCSNQSCSSTPGLFNRYESDQCCRDIPPEDEKCGRDTSVERIVGGKKSALGGWPWITYVLIDNNVLCGGTLIDRSWVLTAGHCFRDAGPNSTVQTYFGRIYPNRFEPHVQERAVTQIILHEQFDKEEFAYYDVALMRLSSPVEITLSVDLACLPNGEKPAVGTRCWVMGYGTTAFRGSVAESLQEVDLLVVDTETCKRVYKDSRFPINEDLMFCAGHVEGGKDSCQGDSGGPLVCQRCSSCQWYVAGVVSFGRGCARPNFFGVYADVEYFEEWISRHTGISVNKNKMCGNEARLTQRWSRWGPWSACSESCSYGTRTRTRTCIGGNVGDKGCQGNSLDQAICNSQDCPKWGDYGPWSECSASCGTGTRNRERSCVNGDPGDDGCHIGSTTDSQNCSEHRCPVWSDWGSWLPCSVSCGGGVRTSERFCNTFEVEGLSCIGSSSRAENCNEQECPSWESWLAWSACSASCNTGSRTRIRSCENGNIGDDGCLGVSEENEDCNTQICGTWTNWQPWSECSASCGGTGRQRSTRECFGGRAGEGGCLGLSERMRRCKTNPCPTWTSWSSYRICSQTCGNGLSSRTRMCENGSPGDEGCIGDEEESVPCNTHDCPKWSEWSDWSSCPVSCGGGARSAERSCLNGIRGDDGCRGPERRSESCNTQLCPFWSDFSEFGSCSLTCSGGQQIATRSCMFGNVGQIGCEGSSEKIQVCNTQLCPEWGDWLQNGSCSRSCDRGVVTERRECRNGKVGQVGCIGDTTRSVECLLVVCPSFWSAWTEYGACTVTCGQGSQTRRRTCEGGDNPSCPGSSIDSRPCGEPCRTRWGEWGEWGSCDKNCSGGFTRRQRGCLDGAIGDPGCSPPSEATQSDVCNEQSCPECEDAHTFCSHINCGLFFSFAERSCRRTCGRCAFHQPWSSWSSCSATCGRGHQRRRRFCPSARTCDGSPEELRGCETGVDCSGYTQWSGWAACSASCEGGVRNRTRSCPSGLTCDPDEHGNSTSQSESCQTGPCPGVWQNWGIYTECTVSCGGGVRTRRRSCSGGEVGELGCEGMDVEESSCAEETCPGSWTAWTAVGECSSSCGPGKQTEMRECEGGLVGGPGCVGNDRREVDCNPGNCTVHWAEWGQWGTCSQSCEPGVKRRTRECEFGEPGQRGCEGDSTEEYECNTGPVPAECVATTTVTATTAAPAQKGNSCSSKVDLNPNCAAVAHSCSVPEFQTFFETNCARTCCVNPACVDKIFCGFRFNCNDVHAVRLCPRTCNLCHLL